VILLSKKASMRIKASNYGFDSEDYDDVGMVQDINGWREV
jgi:predicted ribonuclease YlaK